MNLKQRAIVTAFAFGIVAVAGTVAARPNQAHNPKVLPETAAISATDTAAAVLAAQGSLVMPPTPVPSPIVPPLNPGVRNSIAIAARASTPAPQPTPTPSSRPGAVVSAPGEVTLPSQAESAPKKKSGLEGMMLIDGGCPVLHIDIHDQSTDPQCDPKPFPSTVNIYNTATNTFVTELTAHPNGKYKIDLEPGNYLITTNTDYFMRPTMPWLPPVTVHVSEGGYTSFNIMWDSGIR